MKSTKFVIVSDAHKYVKGFEQVVAQEPQADYYLDLGDNFCGGKPTSFFMETFQSVRGNNDAKYFPDSMDIELYGKKIRMVHGHLLPWGCLHDQEEMYRYMDREHVDILLYGHTHRRVIEINEKNQAIINPGSLSFTRDMDLRMQHLGSYCVMSVLEDGSIQAESKTIHVDMKSLQECLMKY